MSFLEIVERARAALQRNGRVSVRALAREYGLGEAVDELIISTHLARLASRTGKLREAYDRLAGCYARLTEGFDRGPTRKAALDELAARLDAGAPPA